jgi:drug/metabolite transporter (DMT)-like permease
MLDERLAGIGYGLLAVLIWGGFPVVTRFGLTHSSLDTYDIAFIRFSVSGLLLLPVLVRRGLGGLGILSVILMTGGVGAPYVLVVGAALSRAPVGYFALTPGSMIAFTSLLGAAVLKGRLSRGQRWGVPLVLGGMGVAASTALSGTGGPAALALFVLGGLLWAIYNITTRRWAIDAFRATAIVSVGSALVYGPIYLWTRGVSFAHAPLSAIAVQALYQGVFVAIGGLYFYSKAVSILGATTGSTFAALAPLLATVEAALVLGERPPALTLAGIAVVSAGMIGCVSTRRADRSGAALPAR